MPKFQPSTTIYLCAGTGLDLNHSVWMHQYAYATEDYRVVSWWNTLFQWFKCHSIAEGYWYYTYTDPSKGYVDVGRTPLSDGSKGQSGLGSSAKQAELDTNRVDYSEAIADIDYIVFANGDDGGIYDVKYGMVEHIDYINPNVARVYFTIDALLTYQKYFELGRCFIDRDMQYGEWESHDNGEKTKYKATFKEVNTQPEPVKVSESDYILQHLVSSGDDNKDTLDYLDLGSYKFSLCTSDIDIFSTKASASSELFGDFEASDTSYVGDCPLGIGVYCVTQRKNKYFDKMGDFDAFDHILSTYAIPDKIVDASALSSVVKDGIGFIEKDSTILKKEYDGSVSKMLKLPNHFNDDKEIQLKEKTGDFRPKNFKSYTAPMSYISISDKQGSSMELLPQNIIPQLSETEDYYFQLNLGVNACILPNFPSYLYISNTRDNKASKELPFQTLFQVPTYQMTPNNSGSGITYAKTAVGITAGLVTILVVGALTGGIGAVAIAAGAMGAGAASGAAGSAMSQVSRQNLSTAVDETGQAISGVATGMLQDTMGLPKTNGGSPTGMTKYAVNNAGYEIYFCHMRTDLLKIADYMFSIIGYAQNCFRRPHVNTRKNWCYVKLKTVNIHNIGGNNYTQGGTPFWARRQIEQRLLNGVTFWNLRHALGGSPIASYTGIPTSSINMRFVRNYGNGVDAIRVRDNTDHCDNYADDYNEEA